MEIEINKGGFEVNSNIIKSAIQNTVRKLQEIGKLQNEQKIEISVAVVYKKEIKRINKQWRNKNEETDVLSFNYENTVKKLEGEIILCLDVIKENAKKDNIKMEDELQKNVIHSILHIVGYEHGEEMFKLQEKINQ